MQHNQPTSMRCTRCGGSGKSRGKVETRQCPRCRGKGRLTIEDIDRGGL
ncbi:hypothetical protein [Nonomuraea insulae]|uniref:Molecular chaperone DnaJ n=1 Tax=Nonomuraea insulae TaxID=1616787 RepID=A0ABW1CCE7_9ACTN